MMLRKIKLALLFPFILSCTKDVGVLSNGSSYPKEIAEILLTRCSVSGCHNAASKGAASGLSLENWEAAFNGSRGGAIIIPFRPDFSTLCYYTNSFTDLGPSLEPRMPVNQEPLTRADYLKLSNWIKNGAPDNKGFIKFSNSLNKLYVTNQLCDIVTVLDAATKLPMRYVNVGILPKTEFPVCIKLSPDKKYWYVSFLASGILQKFDAATDTYSEQADLGEGSWSSFELTGDSKFAFCIDNNSSGRIAYVDLLEMKVITYYSHTDFVYSRSAAIHNTLKKLYTGTESGNYISVLDFMNPVSPLIKQVILDGSQLLDHTSSLDPVFLYLEESLNLCIVACRGSKEIKLLDTRKDSIIRSIYLGASPSSMDFVKSQKKVLVTCTDDSLSFPENMGSVKIVDVASGQIVKIINPGYQPNGICVNEAMNYAAVVNSNISPKGPRPHHTSACSGRNGYVTFIDLKTMELIPNIKYELAVYPYAIALR